MVRIKPTIEFPTECPHCGSDNVAVNRIICPGIHWLADIDCMQCSSKFLLSLPVAHTIEPRVAFSKKDSRVFPETEKYYWQKEPFLLFCSEIKNDEVPIRKIVNRKCERVIILNTLDYLYGHILLKLYNAAWHLDHSGDYGLVLIIPKSFEWLVPEGCAEVWVVDLKLGQLAYGYEAISSFVEQESVRFSEILVSKAYSHPDFTAIDIERFTGVKPFDIETFTSKKPRFTFALREDRWWLPDIGSYHFFRVLRKVGRVKEGNAFLARRQNKLVRGAIREIIKKIPDAEVFVTGLGKTGSFEGLATDRRQEKLTPDIETEWCSIYAQSHVVIGIHGSNMLLPTAFAAGCVEVLPEDRIWNIVQDISVKYSDRRQLFMYRFADQYSKAENVAKKALGIVLDYGLFDLNMIKQVYSNDGGHS